jgi:hypothetical protein
LAAVRSTDRLLRARRLLAQGHTRLEGRGVVLIGQLHEDADHDDVLRVEALRARDDQAEHHRRLPLLPIGAILHPVDVCCKCFGKALDTPTATELLERVLAIAVARPVTALQVARERVDTI